MASLVVSALSTWSNKGLKKAEKDVSAFDKTIKNLGKTFAGVFSAQAIFKFGKASVKAFMDDEKAAKSLEVALNNLGLGFSAPGIELYISNLQKMYGVLDDELRPAFQTLVTATGNLTLSQEALDTAINVSAATGKSLQTVSLALTRAFSGQTTGLSRLGAGLDKTLLATGDMNKIMAELNKKFSGQATARLSTYAGKMDLLTVATENFKEEIGKGVLDALSVLAKDNSIETATDQMDNFGKSIGDAIYGVGILIGKLDGLVAKASGGNLAKLLLFLTPSAPQFAGLFNFLSTTGANERAKSLPGREDTREIERKLMADRNKEARLLKTSNNLRTIENDLLKKKTEVDKLKEKFDVERLGLMVALNSATDEETKQRLRAQLAILDNNQALAKKSNAELEAANALNLLNIATRGLTLQMGASISDIQKYLSTIQQNQSKGIAPTAPNEITSSQVNAYLAAKTAEVTADTQSYLEKLRTTVKPGYEVPSVESFYGGLSSMAGSLPSSNVNNKVEVTVNGSILALQDLDKAIEDAMLRIQRQNGNLTPAGAIQ
jgi:hypothetical protein